MGILLSVQWLIYDNDARPTGVEVGGLLLAAAADAIGHDAVFDPIWTLLI